MIFILVTNDTQPCHVCEQYKVVCISTHTYLWMCDMLGNQGYCPSIKSKREGDTDTNYDEQVECVLCPECNFHTTISSCGYKMTLTQVERGVCYVQLMSIEPFTSLPYHNSLQDNKDTPVRGSVSYIKMISYTSAQDGRPLVTGPQNIHTYTNVLQN